MLSKNQLKYLRSLRLKNVRHAQREFLAEGETIVAEVLQAMPPELRLVICTPDYREFLPSSDVAELGQRLLVCNEQTLRGISSLDTPPRVVALLSMPSESLQAASPRGLGLYLDGIRDPGNLGAILRIADWFGMGEVFLADDCVDLYNPKAIQASMGAFLRVRARTQSLASICEAHPELKIIGTCVTGGANALEFYWPTDGLLVIGSESHGVRAEAAGAISAWLTIPRGKSATGAESLNAAVATGILCAAYIARHR